MDLGLFRFSDNGESTLGLLFIDSVFQCYTLEDQEQLAKVAGETRIPEGSYGISFRRQLSPLTQRYRQRHPWFSWHLQLMDVPGFENVYIHIGNDDDDTDGCILVGDTANNNRQNTGFVGHSTGAFRRLYGLISAELTAGRAVSLSVFGGSRFSRPE